MLKKINHKGMTLVEIIVVMLISSIVMMIVGSMIVSSMTSFSKTTEADKSKLAVDGISKLVRDELIYATDISNGVVSTTDGWNWFSVNKDGHLLRHDKDAKDSIGVEVFNKDYYSNKKLKFFVKTYKEKNDYKIDLKYQFSNSKDELVYGTSYTVGLINMKNGDYPLFNKATTNEIKEGTKLYYKKGNLNGGIDFPDEDINKGTVADQKGCLSLYNNRGAFVAGESYFKGDMVFENGNWWTYVHTNQDSVYSPPGNSHWWKRISGEFINVSAYEKEDVFYIKTKEKTQYYKCIKDCINQSKCPELKNSNWSEFFIEVPKPIDDNKLCRVVNVYDKLKPFKRYIDFINSVSFEKIEEYKNEKAYNLNEMVRVHNKQFDEWEYFVKIGNGKQAPSVPADNGDISWTKVAMQWDKTSAYEINDVVLWHGQWIKAKKKITTVHDLDQKYGWNNNIIDKEDIYWESLGKRE